MKYLNSLLSEEAVWGAGFLGAQYNPFSVNSDGRIRNLDMKVDERLIQRAYALDLIETNFINQKRGSLAKDHQSVLKQSVQSPYERTDEGL